MNTDMLVGLLIDKRDVLSQLRQLVDCQAPLVAGGDSRKLLGLLATKEKLLTRLKNVEASLDPCRDEDPEDRVWRSAADRQTARDIAAECDRLLAEIMEIDHNDEENLVARHGVVEKNLQRIQTRKTVNAAYSPPHQQGRLDLSSER
jgi:flagellar biosynthesis/type III secretory pathway chaperone